MVYIMKYKSEVLEKFKEWKAITEKLTETKMETFQTDNGGEYTSKDFEDYLKKEGIHHELTIPNTPQQNGATERMNRTRVESVRAMLADSKLSKRFWAEVLATAMYLHNQSPTAAVKEKTPFEVLTGKKPIGIKGYHLHDIDKKKVFYSRDLKFNETSGKLKDEEPD